MSIIPQRKVSLGELAFFSRQVSTMLNSGLHLAQSISVIMTQTRNSTFHQALSQILEDLEQGNSFSAAIAKHPKVFNNVYIQMVKSGEASGKLDTILDQLATRLENENKLVNKIKAASYYPAFIVIVMIIIVAVMMIKVIPQLQDIFSTAGATLPWTTRLIMSTSLFVSKWWWLILIVLTGAIFAFRSYLNSSAGRQFWSRFIITFPFIRDLSRGLYMSRFSRILSMLVKSGLPIIESIEISASVINNEVYESELREVAHEVERGVPISAPLEKSENFPILVSQMISVGEQTGKLDQVLTKLADYYEDETDRKVKAMSGLFEPAMIVLIGLGVGFLVYSIIIPIYQVAQLQIK